MKRIRCPQCSGPITFDDTKYPTGHTLGFRCPHCGKKFAIRPMATPGDSPAPRKGLGSIVVIENVFHYKQVIPMSPGENVIGRYQRGVDINCPIRTDDPSIDLTHCVISVGKDKKGTPRYVLRDGPSNTGTFVDNEILGDRERRVISPGTLFTIGATSIILRGPGEESGEPTAQG